MSQAHAVDAALPPHLTVDYVPETAPATLLEDPRVLAVFGFGSDAPVHEDPRYLRVPLQPYGPRMLEVWRTTRPVHAGRTGEIAWATDGELQFGVIEVDESKIGIEEAAALAYGALSELIRGSQTPHLLRMWNYLSGITLGEGDRERYREFCVGRARGLGRFEDHQLPAATGIGRSDEVRTLQVYWLAARQAGTPVENPRQISAYRYPRQYGPQSPSFARAMVPPAGSDMPLLLSGTASIVGHETLHAGQLLAQLRETLLNFDALLESARKHAPALPLAFGESTRLKVYVRDADDLPTVAQALDERFGQRVPRMLLHAAICRRELAVEIDGVHG